MARGDDRIRKLSDGMHGRIVLKGGLARVHFIVYVHFMERPVHASGAAMKKRWINLAVVLSILKN